jgi:hypothetical protein
MADEGQETKPEEKPAKPGKVYKLKDTPDGAGGKKKKATPEPGAFSRTCEGCGKGLSTDGDKLCAVCALEAAKKKMEPPKEAAPVVEPPPEPEKSFLEEMKEILAEIEREQAVEDKVLEEVKAKFSVKDIPTANWAAGKIAMWQNEVERRKVQSKNYVGEAEGTVKRLKFLFMAQLEAWAKQNCPQDKNHIKLPAATLKFTDTQEKLEVENDQKAVKWATVNLPEAVEMKPVLSELKDYWIASEKKTVPDGCAVIPKGTNFNVV